MDHYSFEAFVAYLEEDLSGMERRAIEEHLEGCPACRKEFAAASRMLNDVRVSASPTPPETLIDRVVSAFRRKQERPMNPPARPATLQFDSWMRLAALGVRGLPQERQFLYSEGSVDLDIQVTRDDETGTLTLQGQILDSNSDRDSLEGMEVQLLAGEDLERRGLTDHLGCFSFTHVPPALYALRVLFSDHDLVMDELDLAENETPAAEPEK